MNELPESVLKRLPRSATFPIKGSQQALVGRIDWAKQVITRAVVTTEWQKSATFEGRVPEEFMASLPKDFTFSVDSPEDHWQIHLTGLNPRTFEVEDLKVIRDDAKFWYYIMAAENQMAVQEYELVFARVWGYLAPILRIREGSAQPMTGRRLITVETAGPGGYIGAVVPSLQLTDQWRLLVQKANNVSPDLTAIPTMRSVRFSVQNPDRPQPREKAMGFSLYEVDLFPELIASGAAEEKGRVKNNFYWCLPDFEAPEGQSFMPLGDYLRYSDGPGMAALYQAIVFLFRAIVGGELPGQRDEVANFPVDPKESYGTPIRVGIIRHRKVTFVVCKTKNQGRFRRSGETLAASQVACEFDPSTLPVPPRKVHKFWAINPNNQRHTGTNTAAGLYPVEVYEYHSWEVDKGELEMVNLCDFARSGDARAQAALLQWIWWVYPGFATLNPDTDSIPSSEE